MAERISFTRPSAERIANAVRVVEQTRPDGAALGFRRQDAVPNAKVFRVATFTGAWAIGASKVVTFKNRTTTPNTVVATNLFFPITSTAAGSRDCGIAKDGTAWFLIDVRLATASAVFVTSTQSLSFVSSTVSGISVTGVQQRTYVSGTATQAVVSDVSISASLNTSNCAITIGKTLSTASVTVASGVSSGLFVSGTASAMMVGSTSVAIFVTGTATDTYLKIAE